MKRRQREISFISEHTAEFVLVPTVVKILKTAFRSVLPIYFWSSREGSRISLDSNMESQVSVVAVFPRRPKIKKVGQPDVLVKFNASLFEYSAQAAQFDIPVLAGVPLASSFSAMASECPAVWFHLLGTGETRGDTFCRLSMPEGRVIEEPDPDAVAGPLDPDAMIQIVSNLGRSRQWCEAADDLRTIKRQQRLGTSFFDFGGYKPVHLLLSS